MGKEGEDDAGEDVAAARGGHAGVAGGIEEYVAFGGDDGAPAAFEYDVAAEAGGEVECFGQAFVAVGGVAGEAVEFSDVGGEDGACGEVVGPHAVEGEYVDCVGVDYDGVFVFGYLFFQGEGCVVFCAESGAYGEGCVF